MLLLSLYLRPVQGLPWKTWFCAKVEKVGPQFLSLRHFYPVERSPRAHTGLKRQVTARFGREPLDCDAGTLGSERSLSALFLSTSGLDPRHYGSLTLRNHTRNCRRPTIRIDIPSAGRSVLRKEILVQALELQHTAGAYTDTVLDHQLGQAASINQDHTLRNARGELDGLGGERRGRYEDAL